MDARKRQAEVRRFLRTGHHEALFFGWPGQNILECAQNGTRALKDALVAEVRHREAGGRACVPQSVPGGDLSAFTRAKVEPMVRGLFPQAEVVPVLPLLEKSVVFVTPESIESVIRGAGFLHTAWALANLYLASIGARMLGANAMRVVGMSIETTCYVSMDYFAEEDPFADFVVHEAAHVFHNTKRATVGLKETRRREWLLPIDFEKRETFAYACEAYSRILEQGKRPADRQALYAQLVESEEVPPDDQVDPEEYLAILAEAVTRRNGWKAILDRCRDRPRRLNVAGGAGRCGSESRSPSRTRGSADPA